MKATFRCASVFLATWLMGGCGGSSEGMPPPCPTNTFFPKFVINSITLPTTSTQFAVDLNGDNILDNRYGAIVQAFATQTIDSQAVITQAIASGNANVLVQVGTSDPTSQNDACANTAVQPGNPTAPPRFDGTDVFVRNPAIPSVLISGPLTAGVFQGRDLRPTSTTGLAVQLPIGGVLVPVTLVAAEATFTVTGTGLASGQVNGAIPAANLPAILGAAATSIQNTIAANPTSALSLQLLAIFDNGGTPAGGFCATTCQNPDTTCAHSGDGRVDACEVSTNALVTSVFAADVQLFDPVSGFYSPNRINASPDSLSVGFGFTGVKAIF